MNNSDIVAFTVGRIYGDEWNLQVLKFFQWIFQEIWITFIVGGYFPFEAVFYVYGTMIPSKKSVKISNLLVILAITCPKTNRSKYRYNNINSFQSNYTVYLSRLSIIFPIHPLKQYKTKNIWEKWSHIKTYSNTCEWRPLLRLSILAISFVAYGTWIAAYKTHTHSSFIIKLDLCYTFQNVLMGWWFLVPFVTSSWQQHYTSPLQTNSGNVSYFSHVHLRMLLWIYHRNNAFTSVEMHMSFLYSGMVFIMCMWANCLNYW